MNNLDKLIDLADQAPTIEQEATPEGKEILAELAADAYEVFGDLFPQLVRLAHDCGMKAKDFAQAFSEGTGIKTLHPGISVDDIVGEILVGGTAHYAQSATRLSKILNEHIS